NIDSKPRRGFPAEIGPLRMVVCPFAASDLLENSFGVHILLALSPRVRLAGFARQSASDALARRPWALLDRPLRGELTRFTTYLRNSKTKTRRWDMPKRPAILLCTAALLLTCLCHLRADDIPVGNGSIHFTADAKGKHILKVWTCRPEALRAKTPIVFVMHG